MNGSENFYRTGSQLGMMSSGSLISCVMRREFENVAEMCLQSAGRRLLVLVSQISVARMTCLTSCHVRETGGNLCARVCGRGVKGAA